MALEIRVAVPSDWPQLHPLLRPLDAEPEAHERFLALSLDERWVVLVADEDGRLVGYAAVQDYGPHLRAGDAHRVARFHDLYVDQAARGRGAGSALVEAVVAWAAVRVRHLEWQAHHERSAPFYEKLGYQGNPCPQPDYPHFEVDFLSVG